MSDESLLTRAKLAQGLKADTPILSYRITETAVIFVADLGIKGCPKYLVLKDELPELPKPETLPEEEQETKPEEEQPKRRTRRTSK